MKYKKFDQKIIDAYEEFISNVYKSFEMLEESTGKKNGFRFLVLLKFIRQFEESMWKKISEEMKK